MQKNETFQMVVRFVKKYGLTAFLKVATSGNLSEEDIQKMESIHVLRNGIPCISVLSTIH